jgi:hypothetical protein
VSTGQEKKDTVGDEAAFETRDFYLACFLRCTGYNLIDLRAEGRRKVFVFRDRPTRRDDVLPFTARVGQSRRWRFPQQSKI